MRRRFSGGRHCRPSGVRRGHRGEPRLPVRGVHQLDPELLDEGDARRKKRKNKNKGKGGKNNERCFKAGDSCSFDDQCCTKTTNRICDVPHGASNSDKECCGGQGAVCGGVNDDGDALGPFCCVGSAGVRSFVCSQNDPNTPFVQGTCLPAPEE